MTTPAELRGLTEDVGQLLVEHRRGSPLEAFTRFADDPAAFAAELLGVQLTDQQLEVVAAVREAPLVCVVGGVGVGKDFAAAVLALHWAICRRGLVLMTASTERQVKGIGFAEVRRLWEAVPALPGSMFEQALRLPGGAGIYAFVSTSASRMQGYHHPRVLAIGSEFQACEPFVLEAMLSCAVGEDSRVVLLGNPLFARGAFHQAAHAASWRKVMMPATAHINVTTGRTVVPGAITSAGLARLAAEYGVDSPTYRSRARAEFPAEDAEGLLRRSWVEAAVARYPEALERDRMQAPGVPCGLRRGPGPPVVAALDPARLGPDLTALAVRRGDVLLALRIWSRLDTMQTVDRVLSELRALGFPLLPRSAWRDLLAEECVTSELRVDSIGVGAGVFDVLRQRELPVVEFNSSRTPPTPREAEQFLNLRASAWWQLRRRFEEGRIAIPEDTALVEELLAVQWRHAPGGRVQVEAKDDLRGRIGRSPDRGDAVMMAFGETPGVTFTQVARVVV